MSLDSEYVFLSYAHENENIAEDLYRRLSEAGIKIWKDKHDLKAGAVWSERIAKHVQGSSSFLVLLSGASVRSRWVREEIAMAMNSAPGLNERLIPVTIEEGVEIPASLRGRQAVHMPGGAQQSWRAFNGLVDSLPGGEGVPRVYDVSGRKPKARGLLLLGDHGSIHAELDDPESVRSHGKQLAEAALPFIDEAGAGIVPHGHSSITLSMLAHLWGLRNAFPRIYWPHRLPGDNNRFEVTPDCSIDLQELREAARRMACLQENPANEVG